MRTPESQRARVMGQNAPEVATQGWFQPDDAQGVGVADSGRSDARVAVRSDDLNLDVSPMTQAAGNFVQSPEQGWTIANMQAVQSSSHDHSLVRIADVGAPWAQQNTDRQQQHLPDIRVAFSSCGTGSVDVHTAAWD